MDERQQKRFEIVDHAIEKGWVIAPSKGMETFIEAIIKLGHCPCVSTRLYCPCPESDAEVANVGRCRCSLFWRDLETFRKILRPVKGAEDEK